MVNTRMHRSNMHYYYDDDCSVEPFVGQRRRGTKKKKKLRPFNKLLRRVGNPIKSTRLACSIIPFFKNPDDRCDFNNNNQAHAIKGILPPPAR